MSEREVEANGKLKGERNTKHATSEAIRDERAASNPRTPLVRVYLWLISRCACPEAMPIRSTAGRLHARSRVRPRPRWSGPLSCRSAGWRPLLTATASCSREPAQVSHSRNVSRVHGVENECTTSVGCDHTCYDDGHRAFHESDCIRVDVLVVGVVVAAHVLRAAHEISVQLLPAAPIFPSAAMTSRHTLRFTSRT